MAVPTEPLNEHQVDVLRRYVRGEDVATIADQLKTSRQVVGEMLLRLCSLNRNAARELLRYAPRADVVPPPTRRPARAIPAAPTPAPARVSAPVPPSPEPPTQPAPVLEPAPEPPTPVGPPAPPLVAGPAFEVLEDWHVWRCRTCRFTNAIAKEHAACTGTLERASVLVVAGGWS